MLIKQGYLCCCHGDFARPFQIANWTMRPNKMHAGGRGKAAPLMPGVRSTIMKDTMPQIRRVIIIGCASLLVLISIHNFFVAATIGQSIIQNIISGSLLFGLAYAIYRQYRWALRLIAAILLLVAVLMPVGIFNPFRVGDYMVAGQQTPSVAQTLLWLIPLEILLLTIVFIIDPIKKRTDHEKS